MENKKKFKIPAFVMLFLVAVVMSFAISGVYSVTKDRIAEAAAEAAQAARTAVMPSAATMEELSAEGSPMDNVFAAYDVSGTPAGYVGQITVIGFGGEIQVTVGMDMSGVITGISVGGANFSETSGLGAKTRDEAFTSQFAGKSGMLVLKQDIDSVTGASVSSGAVVSGVNKALTYMTGLLPEGAVATTAEELALPAEDLASLLPGATSAVWMGGGTGIDGWWQCDNGYIVRATAFGEGPIVVTMGFTQEGVVTGIIIGDENFMESEGLGAKVLEPAYWQQFIGKTGAQTYGAGVDAVTGATVSSEATLSAVNACMTFDPSAPNAAAETAPTAEEPSGEASADAATSASVAEEEPSATPEPTPEPTPVPVSREPAASSEEPDAETSASVVEEEPVPTPEPTPEPAPEPDAETSASVVEEVTPTPEPTPEPDAETSASVTEE